MVKVTEVLESALTLGVEDRAVLAERLLASLDDIGEAEAENLWAMEAKRRLEGYRTGRARAVDAQEVAERVASQLR